MPYIYSPPWFSKFVCSSVCELSPSSRFSDFRKLGPQTYLLGWGGLPTRRVLRLISHVSRQHVPPIIQHHLLLYCNFLLRHGLPPWNFQHMPFLSIHFTVSIINSTLLLILPYIIHVGVVLITHCTQYMPVNSYCRGSLCLLIHFIYFLRRFIWQLCIDCGYVKFSSHHRVHNVHRFLVLFHFHTFS